MTVEAYAVQLPGREDRLHEPPLETWQPMMASLVAAVGLLPDAPTAIFGHSLGAVIALELARGMESRPPCGLSHLFVSGRRWPGGAPAGCDRLDTVADALLLQMLDERFGTGATSLSHPEIRELMLPILRADLKLLADYQYRPAPALACPLTVLAGSSDPATAVGGMHEWHRETTGNFQVRLYEGDHFFIKSQQRQVVADIAASLGSVTKTN